MSLHGSQVPPSGKKKKPSPPPASSFSGSSPKASGGGYTPFSGGASSTPGEPKAAKTPFGGFKRPGMGGGGEPGAGGGLGSIWGPDSTGPGISSQWSESTKLLIAVGAFALVLLGFGLLIFGVLKGGTPQVAASQTAKVVTKFVPQTTSSGGMTDLPFTFTDGTTGDLLYDPNTDLANLGVTLYDSGSLGQFGRQGRQFQIDHGGASFVLNPTPSTAPSGLPAPLSSNVPVVPAASDTPGNFLSYKFGDWHVGVWEGVDNDLMGPTEDQTWAQNLSGTQTASGFLVLTAKPPVKLTPYASANGGGPYMVFGDIYTVGIVLTPEACMPPVGKNVVQNSAGVPVRIAQEGGVHYQGNMCLQSAKMDVQVYGTQEFVTQVTNSLAIKNLKPGPVRTP
ncbi:MAG: hypothetical protein NVSMB32_11620 [Actinomycetota bacterium]